MTSKPDPAPGDPSSNAAANGAATPSQAASTVDNRASQPSVESAQGQAAALAAATTTEIKTNTQSLDVTRSPDKSLPLSTRKFVIPAYQGLGQSATSVILLVAIALLVFGFLLDSMWIGIAAAVVALVVSGRVLWRDVSRALTELLSPEQRLLTLSIIACVFSIISLLHFSGVQQSIGAWYSQLPWEAVGATGEVIGAVGQILIAVLAVYVAWRQYVISKDLTIQQNLITQQQTIDSYFQGISDLVLDAAGLLEDWPQERAIAEGRTAAILSSIDATGKAKVIRFLSRSRLLSPLKRDRHLGRAILDGMGGYQEDRDFGIRVIDLGVMLAAADLSGTDLRWTDLSDVNLIRANLLNCDLVKANLARTILCDTMLAGSDMMGARLFYGSVEKASPRSRTEVPNYETGEHTGAVLEGANLKGVKRLSEEQRQYCCAWGGSKTRKTIPGGCDGIPNLLGR